MQEPVERRLQASSSAAFTQRPGSVADFASRVDVSNSLAGACTGAGASRRKRGKAAGAKLTSRQLLRCVALSLFLKSV